VQVSVSDLTGKSGELISQQPAVELLEGMQTPLIAPRLDKRSGYDPKFLDLDGGLEIPLPKLTESGEGVAARLDDGSPELKYHKFSIVLDKRRRMPLITAANVDWRERLRKVNGRKPTRKELNGFTSDASERWVTDERIPANQQLPDKFYTRDGGFFQKGHVVRRDDVCWGSSLADIQKANGDTFHTTNCTPQLAGFNMANEGEDNWGDLENLIQVETGAERVIVLAGPVLNDEEDLRVEGLDERGEVQIQIPSQFWKIVVANGANGPEAFGFVQEQDLTDVPLELNVPARWRRYFRKI
jgi:endonuclease G